MQPIGIVYRINSLITSEIYIGSTKYYINPERSLNRRMAKHKSPKSKCYSNKIIDYGEGNYNTEIIEIVDFLNYEIGKIGNQEPEQFLKMREQKYIDYHKNNDEFIIVNGIAAWVSEEEKLEKKKNNAVIYANTYNKPLYTKKMDCVCGLEIVMNRPYEHLGKKKHIKCMKDDEKKKEFMEAFQGPVFGHRKDKETVFENAEKDSYPLLLQGVFMENRVFSAEEENEMLKMKLRIQQLSQFAREQSLLDDF